jgi:hypothetical protein
VVQADVIRKTLEIVVGYTMDDLLTPSLPNVSSSKLTNGLTMTRLPHNTL